MPDKNGYTTLRDRFPIVCDVCGSVIEPSRYDEGRLTFEAESYRIIGMTRNYPDKAEPQDRPPRCVYAHLTCLGEKRAKSSMEYLVGLGISADRISIISYGKERPVDTGHNEEAWGKNRRCEFRITSQ